VKVFERLCAEDYTVTDQEGTSFTVERGHVYTTSRVREDGLLTVFSRYWVEVPATVFGLMPCVYCGRVQGEPERKG